MQKRRLSLTLAIAMILSIMIPSFAFGSDYSGHWAEETIQEWLDAGKLKGYEDGSFKPDGQITRAEFMTMVNSAFGYTELAEIDFSDVKTDDWYYSEVQKAVKAGYLEGYEDGTARPSAKITRQQAALIIARIKGLADNESAANIFGDANEIASWAKGGVGAAAAAKYMIGYEDNTFRPLKNVSRAEALVTIDRALENGSDVDTTEPGKTGGGGKGGSGSSDDDDSGSHRTTYATILTLEIKDGVQTINVVTPSAITTGTALLTTTKSAITLNFTTDPATADVELTVYDVDGNKVTTRSALDGEGTVEVELEASGTYTFELVVDNENTTRIRYNSTKYRFTVVKK